MDHHTLFGAAFFRWNAPFLGRGSDQHFTASRAEAAPVHQHAANAPATAGGLRAATLRIAKRGIRGGLLKADLGPIRL